MPRRISRETAQGFLLTPPEARKCRVCGCTDDDCRVCILRVGFSCFWIGADLCSTCAPMRDPAAIQRAERMVRCFNAVDVFCIGASGPDSETDEQTGEMYDFLTGIYLSVRRGLAAKPPVLTYANDIRVGAVYALAKQVTPEAMLEVMGGLPPHLKETYRLIREHASALEADPQSALRQLSETELAALFPPLQTPQPEQETL